MWQKTSRAAFAAAWLLVSAANAIPHDDGSMNMDTDMDMSKAANTQPEAPAQTSDNSPMSYFAYGKHSGTIVAHIALMVLAWCFVLPIAVMFSVARSKFALPSQFFFLLSNALGLLLGIIYNSQTPDLYENNAHHKIGWIVTWVACAQAAMSLIFAYAGREESNSESTSHERAAFLPVSTDDMDDHHTELNGSLHAYRWSRDSGQGTERNSASLNSRLQSPTCGSPVEDYEFDKPEDQDLRSGGTPAWWQNTVIDRFLVKRVRSMISSRVLRALSIVYIVIDRIILPFGFIAIATGGVTYGGIMRGIELFNGLAHFIKGGIFFWYGLLTLGRWMGCCADFGWAWNAKPSSDVVSKWKTKVPSGEFVESLVIFTYGASNAFLEHLAAWGKEWTAMDLEHVSISIMFFGGGLCGMLFENKRVRRWLNTTVLPYPSRFGVNGSSDGAWEVPDTQRVSLNPMPALVILLLGMVMGSHHQDNMTSTMVHKQWGNLLVGFALARGATYVLLYIRPPTSYLPARPPTEVISSFCLISGGLIFMLSTRNVVETMIHYDLDAMFTFTVGMGFTALVMACEVLAIAIKAWAAKRQVPQPAPFRLAA